MQAVKVAHRRWRILPFPQGVKPDNALVQDDAADQGGPCGRPQQAMADFLVHLGAELQVSTIPSPGRVEVEGMPVPASHMNFLISNGRVILPVYEGQHSRAALAELQALMPDHEVIALPANHILTGGGSFHCMTQQVPALRGENR